MYPDYNILKYATDAEAQFVGATVVPLMQAVTRAMETAIPPLPTVKYRSCLDAQLQATPGLSFDHLHAVALRYSPAELGEDADSPPVPDSVAVGTEIVDFVVREKRTDDPTTVIIKVTVATRYGAEGCAELARAREMVHRGICGVENATHGVLAVVDALNATVDYWLVNRAGRFEPIEPGWNGIEAE